MIKTIERFRKKYTLTLLIFFAGTAHSFVHTWSAGDFTNFCLLILGTFGVADLTDKGRIGFIAPKHGVQGDPA